MNTMIFLLSQRKYVEALQIKFQDPFRYTNFSGMLGIGRETLSC